MPLRGEKAKHAADRRQRARHRARGDPRPAQRLKVANDVQPLDALQLDLVIGEPLSEALQIRSVRRERVLRQPLLDGEVVEVNGEIGDEEGDALRCVVHSRVYPEARSARRIWCVLEDVSQWYGEILPLRILDVDQDVFRCADPDEVTIAGRRQILRY